MSPWAILTGPKGSRKSSHALIAISRMRTLGLRVAGFVQQPWTDAQDRKGYELVRLCGGDRQALARPGRDDEPGAFCSFVFDESAFHIAHGWVVRDGPQADVVVIDEVSKLEVAGKGHHDAIRWALSAPTRPVVMLCVRADQMFWVVERFGLEGDDPPYVEVPTEASELDRFAVRILELRQTMST